MVSKALVKSTNTACSPLFVCGTLLVIAREWTPCPLCLCLLWSHTGFWEIFFGNGWYKPVEQDCGEDCGDGQKGDPLIVSSVWLLSLVLVQSGGNTTLWGSWGSLPCSQQVTCSWTLLFSVGPSLSLALSYVKHKLLLPWIRDTRNSSLLTTVR